MGGIRPYPSRIVEVINNAIYIDNVTYPRVADPHCGYRNGIGYDFSDCSLRLSPAPRQRSDKEQSDHYVFHVF